MLRSEEIKIMIVDDHPLIRQGMKKIFDKEIDMKLVCEASNASDAIVIIEKEQPDVVIADISLGTEINGLELVKAIRTRFNKIYTLVLSMHDEAVYAERSIRAGAKGYITKNEDPANVVKAVRTILEGELYLSSSTSKRIVEKLVHKSSYLKGMSEEILTDRELEVFQLIGNGYGTGEIAKKLNLSANTIESHRKKIKIKFGIKSGPDLVKSAVQWVLNHN